MKDYEEFVKKDPVLARVVKDDIVGDNWPKAFFEGFLAAVKVIRKDQTNGIRRLDEYQVFCEYKTGHPQEVQITDLVAVPEPPREKPKKVMKHVK